jgi:hypothetical protein
MMNVFLLFCKYDYIINFTIYNFNLLLKIKRFYKNLNVRQNVQEKALQAWEEAETSEAHQR